jgi:retron-type reverse transcriptase
MLKLDYTNFFPSILQDDLCLHFERHLSDYFDPLAQKLLAQACSWVPKRRPPLRLCIGAPSSPLLSNSIMYEFDCRIAAMAERDEIVYTRYADDITLSTRDRGKIDQYDEFVKIILTELSYPKLKLNVNKTVRASRAGRRVVTGLVLTPEGKISVGRDRKRLIRAMYHRSLKLELDDGQAQILAGLLAFAENIEPGFSQRLKNSVRL